MKNSLKLLAFSLICLLSFGPLAQAGDKGNAINELAKSRDDDKFLNDKGNAIVEGVSESSCEEIAEKYGYDEYTWSEASYSSSSNYRVISVNEETDEATGSCLLEGIREAQIDGGDSPYAFD